MAIVLSRACKRKAGGKTGNKIKQTVIPTPYSNHVYKTVAGVDIPLRVWPAARSSGPGPAPWLLWIHGGGLLEPHEAHADNCVGHHLAPHPWVVPAFRERGYHVVSIGYRLAPHAGVRDMLSDIHDALAFCRANLPGILANFSTAPSTQVARSTYVLGGDSAGGYLALLAAHTLEPRPKAIIEACAVTDMTDYHPDIAAHFPLSGTFSDDEVAERLKERRMEDAVVAAPYNVELPPPHGAGRLARAALNLLWDAKPEFSPDEIRWSVMRNDMANTALRDKLTVPITCRRELFGTEDEYEAEVRRLSPLHLLGERGQPGPEYPPSFIMHGTADRGVPHAHAERFVARLKELGRPVDVRYAVDKGHAFDVWITGPDAWGWDMVEAGLDFVDAHVGKARGRL